MERRRLFGVVGTLLMGLLVGCTETENENQTDDFSFFENELNKNDIDVLELNEVEKNTELTYITTRTTSQGLGDEIGTISASYVLARQNGLDTNRLNSIINDNSGDVASWHIRTEWLEQFESEEITPDEFTAKVLNTVESIE